MSANIFSSILESLNQGWISKEKNLITRITLIMQTLNRIEKWDMMKVPINLKFKPSWMLSIRRNYSDLLYNLNIWNIQQTIFKFLLYPSVPFLSWGLVLTLAPTGSIWLGWFFHLYVWKHYKRFCAIQSGLLLCRCYLK